MTATTAWVGVGLAAQGMFSARFLVQWVASERAGRSTVPNAFWFLSLAGGSLLLGYAIWRRDPVFVLGQSTGLLIYARNLLLIYRPRRRDGESASAAAAVDDRPRRAA